MENKYAFLMVNYETPVYIKDIQRKIKKEDLYVPENPEKGFGYGLEVETHVTVAPCLDNDVSPNDIKMLLYPLKDYTIMLSDVSVFENDEYDVLKCSVICPNLYATNKRISKHFELHTEFKEYNPHITIAYVKKGTCREFLKRIISKQVFCEPVNFSWGYFDGDDYVKKTWK